MQMRIRIECGFDSRSRAGVWPNDRAGVRAVRTIQGGKNEVPIRFGCGLDLRIYDNREYNCIINLFYKFILLKSIKIMKIVVHIMLNEFQKCKFDFVADFNFK
jgi:hypothetical protein